jgi:hypothetical protein
MPAWVKDAVDAWTAAAGITEERYSEPSASEVASGVTG